MQESGTPEGARAENGPDKHRRPGLNDMAEDIFGLSLRGLASMWDAVVHPAAVFSAARTPDWNQRYTPSIRLVTSIIAVMLLLRIFWAAESSAMYQMTMVQMQQTVERFPELGDPQSLAERYFNDWSLVFPVIYIIVHLLASLTLGIWGARASLVTRIRLYFVGIIPGLGLATLVLAVTPLLSMQAVTIVTAASLIIAIPVYGATVYRGLGPVMPRTGARLWRAALFAFVVSLADVVSLLGANLVAGILVGIQSSAGG